MATLRAEQIVPPIAPFLPQVATSDELTMKGLVGLVIARLGGSRGRIPLLGAAHNRDSGESPRRNPEAAEFLLNGMSKVATWVY